jgi:hypothetical protein
MRRFRFGCTVVTGAVVCIGLWLFGLGLFDQWRRFRLFTTQGIGFHDPACGVSFCDTSAFWLAGRLAIKAATATVYHAAAFATYGAAILPGHLDHYPFPYTPVSLFPAALLSLAPLATAYVLFTLATIAAAILVLRRAAIPWLGILVGLAGPAAMWSIYLGQFGLICGALLVGALALLDRRPAEAGTLLGLLILKPPYAVVAPVVVLAGRHWRAMVAGLLTLVLLVAMSVLCFGLSAWSGFLGPGRATAHFLLVTPFGHGDPVLGVSVFWMLRSLGAGIMAATAVQIVVALAALAATAWLWRGPVADPPARLLATLCLLLLTTPYGYGDDMVGLSVALALNFRRAAPIANAVLAVVWLSPALIGHFLQTLGFLTEPLFIAAALVLAVLRLGRDWRMDAVSFRS